MKKEIRRLLSGCLIAASPLLLPALPAIAQEGQPVQVVQNAAGFTQQDLDQMLAPIALYPDGLLSQILMAATYPLEVVQAARWSRANPGIAGEQAVRAVDSQNWDPSVKSLVAFPQVLELMDNSLGWTERLGDAFLSQESQVWDTIQALRERASAAGNLQSSEQMRVIREGPVYVIEPAVPDILYVPYYDPLVVYGNWWWPGYAPMRWAPWPGYYDVRPGYGRGFYWGGGISIGFGFFFGGVDWHVRHTTVINRNSFYYRNVNPRLPVTGNWQHDPSHRHGVPYRDPRLRQQFTQMPGAPTTLDNRRDYRGRLPATGPGPGFGNVPRDPVYPRLPAPGTGNQPGAGNPTGPRTSYDPDPRQHRKDPPVRSSAPQPYPDPAPRALEGIGRGRDARDASSRGQASLPRPSMQTPPPVIHNSPRSAAPMYSAPAPSQQMAPAARSAPHPAPQPPPQMPPQAHQPTHQSPAPAPGNPPRKRGDN